MGNNEISKPTSGPWYPVQYANFFNIQDEDFYAEANLFDLEHFPNAEANARLAALAPNFLEALKTLVDVYIMNKGRASEFVTCITPKGTPDYWIKAIRLIEKAEGKEVSND